MVQYIPRITQDVKRRELLRVRKVLIIKNGFVTKEGPPHFTSRLLSRWDLTPRRSIRGPMWNITRLVAQHYGTWMSSCKCKFKITRCGGGTVPQHKLQKRTTNWATHTCQSWSNCGSPRFSIYDNPESEDDIMRDKLDFNRPPNSIPRVLGCALFRTNKCDRLHFFLRINATDDIFSWE